MLTAVVEKLDSLRVGEVVGITVSLNKMENYEMGGEMQRMVRTVAERFRENIQQLEEKSIKDFLRGEHHSKIPTFRKIY